MNGLAYYDGTKLLSMKDINGQEPEIYIVTTNRTGGKTTYFNRWAVNSFLKGKGKFGLVYRYNYELDDIADKFFKDIGSLFFPGREFTSARKANGIYQELFLDGKSCGYAVSINSADQIKKYSHLFSDVNRMIFDEFQSETNHYCSDEIKKFISVHTSIARGQGEMTRYVPVVMISNPVSIINPYYVELGISARLQKNTRFLRGDGFVMEQGYNEEAANALKQSGFNRAFAQNEYVAYAGEAVYLNDSMTFVERQEGYYEYIATLKYKGNYFAIKEYPETGVIYVDDKPDLGYRLRISVTTQDHDVNYVMLKRHDDLIINLRFFFSRGCFRFKDLRCKEALMTAISY